MDDYLSKRDGTLVAGGLCSLSVQRRPLLTASGSPAVCAGERPLGVYALYDDKHNLQYVGYSRNIVLAVKVRLHHD